MTVLMSREHYRDLFAWSLVECEGRSWHEACALADLVLDPCICDLQAQEDARLFEILDAMYVEQTGFPAPT